MQRMKVDSRNNTKNIQNILICEFKLNYQTTIQVQNK